MFHALFVVLLWLVAVVVPTCARGNLTLPRGHRLATQAIWGNPDFMPIGPAMSPAYDPTFRFLFTRQTSCPQGFSLCSSGWCCESGGGCCGGESCCPNGWSCADVDGVTGCCRNGAACDESTMTATCTTGQTVACDSAADWCCNPDETCSETGGAMVCISNDANNSPSPTSSPTNSPTSGSDTTTSSSNSGGGLSTGDKVAIISTCIGVPSCIVAIWQILRCKAG